MDSTRWKQIESLVQSALRFPAEQCDEFVRQACAGDELLEREVRSLLKSQKEAGSFLEVPAMEMAAKENPFQDLIATQVAAKTQLGLAGQTISHYKILEMLGAGGMGVVYKAFDTKLNRTVALKFLSPHLRHQEELKQRLTEEARSASALDHPNIVVIHEIGESPDGDLFIAMAYQEGATLRERIDAGLELPDALQIARQIASGLAKAHEHGIFHRDIKPSNIIVAKDGTARIIDFGLAKSIDATVTTDGSTKGTPLYMSPEQASGKGTDFRTDLWSLGVVLYEMLDGTPPFCGDSQLSVMRAIVQDKPAKLRDTHPGLPAEVEAIVSRALEKDPAKRYQSASDMAGDLSAVLTASGPLPSARLTPLNGITKKWKVIVPAVAALVASFGAGYVYLHRAPARLTDKDTIVLADFVNNTGDPVFDGTLRQGLAVQMEQSPFLKIMDDQHVQRILRLMSLKPGARITNPIAHEICVRVGATATIDGAITNLGKSYVVTLQAIACQDGATLAREQIQAEDKEHVLNAVGTASTAIRGKLGESLNSIQKLNIPLEQATTSSLEALQSFSAGYLTMLHGDYLAAFQQFERAIAIDPNFAAAYFWLAVGYEQAGDNLRSRKYAEQAFGLVDRVSEWERVKITGYYYLAIGDLDKAIDAEQLGSRNYPRSGGFHNALGMIYVDMGRYEEGLKEGLEGSRLDPEVEFSYRRQLDAYICLDRLPEARALANKLRVKGLGGARIHLRFLELAYVDGDQAAIDREIQWFAGKPDEYFSFGLQAANLNVHGKLRESHKMYQRAAQTALRRGLPNAAAEFEEADARVDALSGNCQTARRLGRPALALALCGDAAKAEKLAAETSKIFPNGTLWNAVQLPEIRAAIALTRDQPAKSVELLASAAPYERAYLDAIYLRGLVYLRLNKGQEAVAEFWKIVDHKGANWASDWHHPYQGQFYSLSYLGMARGYVLAGDTANARKAFQDFFELWKDADSDIPILQQAKGEYAKLR